jgi:hypothetical protein
MSFRRLALAFGAASAVAVAVATVYASDPVGVYCVVSKVVMTPDEQHPTAAQVWGACALPTPGVNENGQYVMGWYTEPKAGYLYYSLTPGKEDLAAREWRDLKSAAGSGDVVAFGARYQRNGRLRLAAEKIESPDPYPIQMGVVRMKASSQRDEPGYSYTDLFAALRKAAK